jgi:hypothetical protein
VRLSALTLLRGDASVPLKQLPVSNAAPVPRSVLLGSILTAVVVSAPI